MKYYKLVFQQYLPLPVYFDCSRDILVVEDTMALLTMLWSNIFNKTGHTDDLHTAGIREIQILDPMEWLEYNPKFKTLLRQSSLPLLEFDQILPYMCMRIRTVERIIIERDLASIFSADSAANEDVWAEAFILQEAFDTFTELWEEFVEETSALSPEKQELCSENLVAWNVPKIQGYLNKTRFVSWIYDNDGKLRNQYEVIKRFSSPEEALKGWEDEYDCKNRGAPSSICAHHRSLSLPPSLCTF